MTVIPFASDGGSGVAGWTAMTQKAKRALVRAAIERSAHRMLRNICRDTSTSLGGLEETHDPGDQQLARDERMLNVYGLERARRAQARAQAHIQTLLGATKGMR